MWLQQMTLKFILIYWFAWTADCNFQSAFINRLISPYMRCALYKKRSRIDQTIVFSTSTTFLIKEKWLSNPGHEYIV